MADITEAYAALQKADAAGDTAGAKQLADYIRTQSGQDAAQTQQAQPAQAPLSFSDYAKSYGSAIVRPIAKGVAALPLMAMDAGVAARNVIGNAVNSATGQPATPNYTLPSEMFNQSLDQYTQAPTNTVGKVAEGISSAIAGGVLTPRAAPQFSASDQLVPSNFVRPQTALAQNALPAAQRQGYVVPPSQSNPTFTNRLLEGLSGKLKLQQEMAMANQPRTTEIAAEALGQNPDAPLTQGALAVIRQEAVKDGYAPIKNIGTIVPGPSYTAALDKIVSSTQGATKSFPGIKAPDIAGIVEPLRQEAFNSSDAVDAISVLRGQADEAFSGGQSQAGRAYKAAAKALEDAIEQHLEDQGQAGSSTLDAFRAARTQIAKSINIGKALNEGNNQVSAIKIGQQLASGAPLTGPLRDVGIFARAYPKVAQAVTEIHPSISPLDTYGSVIAAGATGNAAPLGIPITRMALRAYLMSPAGQARAVQQISAPGTGLGVLDFIPQIGLAGNSR